MSTSDTVEALEDCISDIPLQHRWISHRHPSSSMLVSLLSERRIWKRITRHRALTEYGALTDAAADAKSRRHDSPFPNEILFMTPNTFAIRLVENLKALNAKERDHLMRFAYLGATERYDDHVTRWLSNEMEVALCSQLKEAGLATDAQCVFASMDYHLDWLYVALLLACADEPTAIHDQTGALDEAPPLGDETLGYLIGIHEDIDLLVVFANEKSTVVLCIEAKGDAAFDKKQLARKWIRLDRIIDRSGASCRAELTTRMVLMGPPRAKPRFSTREDFIKALPKNGPPELTLLDQLSAMGKALKEPGSTGNALPFVPLQGFPDSPRKITRSHKVLINERTIFTRWKIKPRWNAKGQ